MVHRNKINPRSDTTRTDRESRIKSKRDREKSKTTFCKSSELPWDLTI